MSRILLYKPSNSLPVMNAVHVRCASLATEHLHLHWGSRHGCSCTGKGACSLGVSKVGTLAYAAQINEQNR